MIKKIIVKEDREGNRTLQELLIEHNGFDCRTVAVLQKRPATEKELYLYSSGSGRLLRF